jgi:hypothetical protein
MMLSRSRNVSPETVSVRPYASANHADGNVRWIRSMSGMGIFSPPLMITRTDDRSRDSTSGRAMIAFTIAGASHTVVTPDRSISSTTAAASKAGWMIVVAPTATRDVVVRSSAPTWYSGPHARPRSSRVKPNSTMWARFFQARLACVSITPLGRPVVPEVYMRRCTSSGAVGAIGGGVPSVRSVVSGVHPAWSTVHARTTSMPVPARASSARAASSASHTMARAAECSRM